jgi:epoxide hydrolase-like predicted phosphatase
MNSKYFIYFDVGGTLLDYTDVFKSVATKFDLTVDQVGDVFDEHMEPITKGLMDAKDFWEKCIQKYDLKNAKDYDFLESWVADYKPIKETHDILHKVKSKYKVGLLSNIYKGMLPLLLDKGDIPNVDYDQIIFSCDVGMMKPDKEIYELASNRAGTEPNKIIFIDDKERFIDGAKQLGWNTFLFDNKNRVESVKEFEEFLNITCNK